MGAFLLRTKDFIERNGRRLTIGGGVADTDREALPGCTNDFTVLSFVCFGGGGVADTDRETLPGCTNDFTALSFLFVCFGGGGALNFGRRGGTTAVSSLFIAISHAGISSKTEKKIRKS